jgi:hypothetical protein
VDRLTLQATTSGSIQDAQAPQKIRAKIGPAENGKGRSCIFLEQPPAYDRMSSSWLSISSRGSTPVLVARFVVFILGMIWPGTAAIVPPVSTRHSDKLAIRSRMTHPENCLAEGVQSEWVRLGSNKSRQRVP